MKYLTYIYILFFAIKINAQERSFLREGNSEYEKKDFQKSEIKFRKAISENKNSVIGHYNLGNVIYKQDRQEEAIAEYDLAAKSAKDKKTKANAFFNKGNALMKTQKISEAIDAYKNSLRNIPNDKEAKYNLALAKKMLKQQQNKDDKNNKDSKDKDDKKDKNKDKNKDDNKDNKDKNKEDKKDDNKDDKDNKDKNKEDKKDDNKDDNKDNKDKNKEDNKDNNKEKPAKGQISKADMQRILEALKNQEDKIQKKVNAKRMKGKAIKTEKDW